MYRYRKKEFFQMYVQVGWFHVVKGVVVFEPIDTFPTGPPGALWDKAFTLRTVEKRA